MKEINPAKVAVICFLFLVTIYFTSAIDWAIAVSFIAYGLLYGLTAVWFFMSALIFFGLFLVFNFLLLKIDIIRDLSVSSYLLFAGGIATYFREGQKGKWEMKLPFREKMEITREDLLKLGGIAVFVLLIYPLTSSYLAAVAGYIAFLLIFKKSDGRYAFAIALLFLILCPFLLIAKKDKTAEISAIFTYYFLVIGTIQEIIMMVKHPSEYKDEDEGFAEEKIDSPDTGNVKFMRHSERVRAYQLMSDRSSKETSGTRFSKNKKIVWLGIFVVILAAISFIFYKPLTNSGSPADIPGDKSMRLTITPKISPVISQVLEIDEAKMASEAAKLRIFVDNGTMVKGYAGTVAGELKKSGIKNITVGNADRGDYKNWELIQKNENKEMADYIKKILNLTTLKVNPASSSAQFDMMITIGENK